MSGENAERFACECGYRTARYRDAILHSQRPGHLATDTPPEVARR